MAQEPNISVQHDTTASHPSVRRFSWHSFDGLTLSGIEWPAHPDKSQRIPVLCLAGLSRNCKDFNSIAQFLQALGHRVIALDYRGRGQSAWDPDWQNYSLPIEGKDIDDAVAYLNLQHFAVLGTSRGGLHAMAMAERYEKGRILSIILNDIGPRIEMKGIHRLAANIGKMMQFPDQAACAAHLMAGLKLQFPDLAPQEWMKFAGQLGEKKADGFTLDYDPALAKSLALMDEGAPLPDLWPLFQALKPTPLLILRGEHSDILSLETADRMHDDHPNAQLVTIPGQGHAPLLWDQPTQQAIGQFLEAVVIEENH